MRRKSFLAFFALTVVVTLALLIGPRLPPPTVRPIWFTNVDLPGPFGLSLSVDSPAFMNLALDPSGLLAPEQFRQSRPGLVLAAALLVQLLAPLIHPPVVASYVAYLLLNIAILMASFGTYLAIVSPSSAAVSVLVFLPGLLLLFNDVTTMFMLSPHTAMLNILAPLVCLWIADRAWRNDLLHQRRVFLVALLAGLAFAAYGSFALAFPALLLPAGLRDWTAGRRLGAAFFGRAAAILAATLAPIGAWYALVVARTGTFFSAEVEVFRSFAWMADLYGRAGLWAVADKLVALAALAVRHGLMMTLPALAVIVATVFVVASPRRDLWPRVRTNAALAVFICVLFGVFFTLSGFAWDRNVYSTTVPFIALAGSCVVHAERLLAAGRLQLMKWGLVLAMIPFAAFMMLKDVTWWFQPAASPPSSVRTPTAKRVSTSTTASTCSRRRSAPPIGSRRRARRARIAAGAAFCGVSHWQQTAAGRGCSRRRRPPARLQDPVG